VAAYRADIEIGVRGIQQLQNVSKQIQTLSTGVDAVNKRLNGATQNLSTYDRNLAKAASTLQRVNAGTLAEKDAVRQYVQALGLANAARDRQNKLIQEQIALQRKAVATSNAGFGVQGPALPPAATRARSAGGANAGNAISSAIIGGGFPLLFGQGPGAAAGGALGGLAGGLLGGGFGFALSIAGTAIGDLIAQTDKLNVSLAGLNSTLADTGSTSQTTANDISTLAKNLQITKDEALELLATFKQFNEGDVREALARGFGGTGGAQTFEAIARAGVGEKEALDAIFSLRKEIGNEAAEQLALQLRSVGATETQAALLKLVVERNIENLVAQAKTVQFGDRLLSAWEGIVAGAASAVTLATKFIAKMQEGSLIRLPFLDRIEKVLGKIVGRTPEQIAEERGKTLEQQLKKDINAIRNALKQETQLYKTQSALSDQLKPGRTGKSAAEREAEQLEKRRQKQLETAARLAVVTNTQVEKAAAVSETEKLSADYNFQRMERMTKYESLYRDALSTAEREYLITAQINEIAAQQLEYERELLEVQLRQSDIINQAKPIDTAQRELSLLQAKLQGKEEEFLRQEKINELVKQGYDLTEAAGQVDTQMELNKALEQQVSTQQRLNDVINQVGQTATGVFEQLIFSTNDWRDSLNGALKSLASLLFQAGLQGLAGSDGRGFFSFLTGGIGKRAMGGPVTGGSPYIVGERGPELFVPGRSGSIVPNHELGGSGVNVVVNVDAKGTSVQGNDQQGNQLGRAVSAAVQAELVKQKRPGGLLA
jgi:hypothetical protein